MKLKNQTVVNAVKGFQTLAEKELPYATTLKISKNINILEELLKEYNKEYNKLAEEYLVKENGRFVESPNNPGSFLVKENKIKEYSEKLFILNNFENDVNIYKIKSNELADIKISAKTLLEIKFMIEEEQEEDE
jgi:hypothetical protein